MTSGEGDEQGPGRENIRVVPEGLPGRPLEVTFGIGGQLPEAGTFLPGTPHFSLPEALSGH